MQVRHDTYKQFHCDAVAGWRLQAMTVFTRVHLRVEEVLAYFVMPAGDQILPSYGPRL